MRPGFLNARRTVCARLAAVTLAESGATAPELCALFGWSKLETAEIYIREAQKRADGLRTLSRVLMSIETGKVSHFRS